MNVHKVFGVLVFLLLISTAYSQKTGVDIKPIDPNAPKPSSVQLATSWIMEHIWLIVIFLGIGFGIFIFLYIWKKATVKPDPFFENWKKTKELCKLNKRWSIKDVYRVSGDTGLSWLGDYEGDVILDDGSINVMWANWKWGFWGKLLRIIFFPLRPIWKLVMREYSILKAPFGEKELLKVEVKTQGEGDKIQKTIEKTFGTKTIDYVVFDNSGNVLIKAISLSKSKNFYCPVVTTEKGEIVDTRLHVFEKEQSTALIDGLYNLTQDFANIMRERISIEPKVRYIQKTEGTEVSGSEGSG
jgi:hypothetical protein